MKQISLFNDVLGPVMRGPSSSHTAGSYHLGRIASDLLGARPARARIAFDPNGSYAQVFREQGVDRGFAVGLLGWTLTDARFERALELASSEGLELSFDVHPLAGADHPNTVEIHLECDVRGAKCEVHLLGRSIGGGAVDVIEVNGWRTRITGETFEVLVETEEANLEEIIRWLTADGRALGEPTVCAEAGDAAGRRFDRGENMAAARSRDGVPQLPARTVLVHALRTAPLSNLVGQGFSLAEIRPIAFVKRGPALFDSAGGLIELAESRGMSLGRIMLAHEASLLGLSEREVLDEMLRRLDVMRAAVAQGLSDRAPSMQLLDPSARKIFERERRGHLAAGGPHTRAAARALAAMHVNSGMGVVCAAPTGGSAGVLPGVIVTLLEDGERLAAFGSRRDPVFGPEEAALALFAAGAIGVVVAARATFAAEVAGCQVEIGAAGAMSAAAVVEAAGGTARQAADAAAIAFQNTMGSVCDLVQGLVEIPCHTRNAVAASSAFVCADLVLGGYANPIPFDETVDAVFAVGRMLPSELRCTARGGLATTPSALRLVRKP